MIQAGKNQLAKMAQKRKEIEATLVDGDQFIGDKVVHVIYMDTDGEIYDTVVMA